MMTYSEAILLSEELRERYDAPFNSEDKERIATLYRDVLAKEMRRTNCQQCYHDALIEIICFLRKEKRMAERSKYVMRAGFIIKSPLFHDGKIFTNQNLTDEVAEEYMEMFPNKKNMFDVRKDFVPTDEKKEEVANTPPKEKKPRKPKKNRK